MKKILIDSSVWVSYFLGLKKNGAIFQKVMIMMDTADLILIPEIVYVEVLNVLRRLGKSDSSIAKVKKLFDSKKFYKYQNTYDFWFKKLEFYMKKVRLETQDLAIIATNFEQWPCELITGDKKLQIAYDFLKNTDAITKS